VKPSTRFEDTYQDYRQNRRVACDDYNEIKMQGQNARPDPGALCDDYNEIKMQGQNARPDPGALL
jgi:hypothetical protein